MSPHLGCYGDKMARTPNIDRFAASGVRFSNATVVAPVCAPCRSSIITGMYPTTLGTHLMRCRARLPDFVQPFPVYLRQAGYYCTNNSKKDYQFVEPPETWDESSAKAHWRNRARPDQPFFAVFNFVGTHESQIFGLAQHRATTVGIEPCDRNAIAATLPPYYPDTAETREDWGRYYDNVAAMDRWFGKMLDQLKADGLADETIVFFWSDHGVGLPRAKRWLYDSGLRVPLVVYVPPKWRDRFPSKEGIVDDRLVMLMDLGPTVLNLAGVAVPSHVQGQPFLGPNQPPAREFAFAARDRMDERYDVIRAVRDGRYKYIVNFQAWKPYYQHVSYGEQSGVMKEIRRLARDGRMPQPVATFCAADKPFEELYDLQRDPHEVDNVIGDPKNRPIVQRMRSAQREWMRKTLDLGLIPESEIVAREEKLGSRQAILHQSGRAELLERLIAAAESVSSGRATDQSLIALLDDPDPAVRWWAVTGLGNLTKVPDIVATSLEQALKDSSPSVRVAAARATCRTGDIDAGMAVLLAALRYPSPWTQLEAALVLDELGNSARPAVDALREIKKGKDDARWGANYPARVAQSILAKWDGGDSSH